MGSHMESQADIMRRDPGLECESQADLSPFEYGKRDSAAMAATTRTMKQFKSRLPRISLTLNPQHFEVLTPEDPTLLRILEPRICRDLREID